MSEHSSQPSGVGGGAGEVAELDADSVEFGVDACGCAAACAGSVVPVAVEVFDVVELGDGLLAGDFGGESGVGGA